MIVVIITDFSVVEKVVYGKGLLFLLANDANIIDDASIYYCRKQILWKET